MNRELLPLVSQWNSASAASTSVDGSKVVAYCIGIGTPERAVDFCSEVGFPASSLLADPTNACYDKLALRFGIAETFFSFQTPLSMRQRLLDNGAATLREIMPRWKPWLPPKQKQALNQGGTFVIKDGKTFLAHYDEATGDHVDFKKVIHVIESLQQQ